MLETLRWLGLDWDEGPYVQSDDLEPYRAAMRRLSSEGRAFPCALTRTQIEHAASAPQEGAHDVRYPPELRPTSWERRFEDAETNWRFLVGPEPVGFDDAVYGPQSVSASAVIGDFVVWTKRGTPAYQLAVVVDDHRQRVSEIVRGADLLDSAARQLLLYRALGLGPEPRYTHLPLVIGPDGKRLAKRHGDSRLDRYRAAGVRPERVVGLLARWCGLDVKELSAREFMSSFDLANVPKTPIVFTPADDARLIAS